MHQIKYALFYDFHTSPNYPGVGMNFDADAFTDRLLECGVDYLTFHARCNMGTAYYPTKVGIPHPSLKHDLFGELAHACKQKGIALTAYLNGGISQAEWIQHREWGRIDFDGKAYADSQGDRCTPMLRTMCYNTPYRDRLISMVQEIARTYPVAGFFLDCMSPFPCICPTCVKEMQERGMDWHDLKDVTAFADFSAARLADDISRAAREINPEFLLYFNCVPYETQAQSGTYLECECIPSRSCWGYEYLPVLSHYMRTLGKPCLNMTGRFFSWGDFGGLRSPVAIKSELLYGLANGMRPNIGDHFLPHGELCQPVLDEVKSIYSELHTMDEWFDDAKPAAEIAVVFPLPLAEIRYAPELRGAVRLLSELHCQFDIVTKASSWDRYRLLILPDSIRFEEDITRRIKRHLEAGGKIISSGWSGLDDKGEFALPEYWGVTHEGDCTFTPAFFQPEKELSKDIPDMPFSVNGDGILLKPATGTRIGARLVRPHFSHEWNGLYPEYYNAPETVVESPFLTLATQVAHFSHAIFSGYKQNAAQQTRLMFRNVLNKLLPERLLKIDNAPSYLRGFVTRQTRRTMIHLLAYIPEQRSIKSEIIEDELVVEHLTCRLKCDGNIPTHVYSAPDRTPLDFCMQEDVAYIHVPRIKGHALLAVEF